MNASTSALRRVVAVAAGVVAIAAANVLPVSAATAVVDLDGARAYVRSDQALPLCDITLFVRAGLDQQTADQSGLAALTLASIAQTPTDGVALVDAVAARGGSLRYEVEPQYVRISLESTPDRLPALASLVASALAHPGFDAPTLAAARVHLTAAIASDERDPRRVGTQMLTSAHYSGAGAMPPLGTAASLANFSSAQVSAFFASWYARGSAFVTVVGRSGSASDSARRTLVNALAAGSPAAAAPIAVRPFGVAPRRLVTSRDIGVPFVVLGFDVPGIGDADFAAALVMKTLLSDVLEPDSSSTLPPSLRTSGTNYTYDLTPAQLTVWFNAGRVDPTQALSAFDAVLKRVASEPVDAAAITRFRDRARGEWILENITLAARAAEVGNSVAHGLDPDYAASVNDAIARVTAADVQRVAKKYFVHFDVALVLPRDAPGG